MNRSLIAAMKPGKTSIAITYDLAIAKVVMQIQSEESPKSVKERITNYERCKSFHEFLAVVLEDVLYEQYLNAIDNKNKYCHNLPGNKNL